MNESSSPNYYEIGYTNIYDITILLDSKWRRSHFIYFVRGKSFLDCRTLKPKHLNHQGFINTWKRLELLEQKRSVYRITNSSDANFPLGSWNFGFLVFFLQIINRQIKKQCNISCQFRRTDYWFADTKSTSYFNSIIKHKTVRKTAWQLSLMHTFKCDRNGRLSEGT